MLARTIPWITQMVLAPLTIYMIFFVFIKDHNKSYELISGLIAFSAVLSALSYSAAGACDEEKERFWYNNAGRRFFEATVMGGICLIINYLYISEVTQSMDKWSKIMDLFVGMLRGVAYGVGAVQLHFGVWIIQREFAKKP